MKKIINRDRKLRRTKRVSSILNGTKEKPRVCMYRSNHYTYAQLIDDVSHVTIMSVTSKNTKEKGVTKSQAAFSAGKLLGEKMLKEKLTQAVFDRRGYAYNGRVKQFAEGIRSSGVNI